MTGKEITFSDGRVAIVDKGDAGKLAIRAGQIKTAEIAKLQEIIDNAVLVAENVKVEHKKFDSFSYYAVRIDIGTQTQDVLLNVGHGKFDGQEHFYALKEYKKSNHLDNTSSSVDNLKSGYSSNNSILSSGEKVNTQEQNSSEKTTRYALSEDDTADTDKNKGRYTLSAGQIKKVLADYTQDKSYTKAQTESIINTVLSSDVFDFGDTYGDLSKKSRSQVITTLWESLNTSKTDVELQQVASDTAEYIKVVRLLYYDCRAAIAITTIPCRPYNNFHLKFNFAI